MTSRYHITPDSTTNGHALPDAVMDDDTISPMGKVLYWYLLHIASLGDNRARVSISTIAVEMGLSSRQGARRCLDELVKAGWLEVVHHESPDGKVDPALDYVIHSETTPTCNGGAR